MDSSCGTVDKSVQLDIRTLVWFQASVIVNDQKNTVNNTEKTKEAKNCPFLHLQLLNAS